MARIGGGIEQLEQLQSTFTRAAQMVEELAQMVSSQISGTEWEGPAAERFRSEWTGDFEPALRRVDTALQEAGAEVGRRKEALLQAGS
jgi:WXG100 family type VII secretion target